MGDCKQVLTGFVLQKQVVAMMGIQGECNCGWAKSGFHSLRIAGLASGEKFALIADKLLFSCLNGQNSVS